MNACTFGMASPPFANRADVRGAERPDPLHVMLHAQVPDLDKTDPVVWINGERVRRDAGRRSHRERRSHQDRSRVGAQHGVRVGERRLRRQLLRRRHIRNRRIVDAVPASHRGRLRYAPREAEARRHVVPIRREDGIRELPEVGPDLACLDGRRGREVRRRIQRHQVVARFRVGRLVFVAGAEIHRQLAAEAPVILKVN